MANIYTQIYLHAVFTVQELKRIKDPGTTYISLLTELFWRWERRR
jgi:hypothetical protein